MRILTDKVIEEMLEAQCVFYGECDHCPVYPKEANPKERCVSGCEMLYKANYRKADDVIDQMVGRLMMRLPVISLSVFERIGKELLEDLKCD